MMRPANDSSHLLSKPLPTVVATPHSHQYGRAYQETFTAHRHPHSHMTERHHLTSHPSHHAAHHSETMPSHAPHNQPDHKELHLQPRLLRQIESLDSGERGEFASLESFISDRREIALAYNAEAVAQAAIAPRQRSRSLNFKPVLAAILVVGSAIGGYQAYYGTQAASNGKLNVTIKDVSSGNSVVSGVAVKVRQTSHNVYCTPNPVTSSSSGVAAFSACPVYSSSGSDYYLESVTKNGYTAASSNDYPIGRGNIVVRSSRTTSIIFNVTRKDTDGDGIYDLSDACPTVAYRGGNGCPPPPAPPPPARAPAPVPKPTPRPVVAAAAATPPPPASVNPSDVPVFTNDAALATQVPTNSPVPADQTATNSTKDTSSAQSNTQPTTAQSVSKDSSWLAGFTGIILRSPIGIGAMMIAGIVVILVLISGRRRPRRPKNQLTTVPGHPIIRTGAQVDPSAPLNRLNSPVVKPATLPQVNSANTPNPLTSNVQNVSWASLNPDPARSSVPAPSLAPSPVTGAPISPPAPTAYSTQTSSQPILVPPNPMPPTAASVIPATINPSAIIATAPISSRGVTASALTGGLPQPSAGIPASAYHGATSVNYQPITPPIH